MAATFQFVEDNGAATGNPAVGATRTTGVTQCNWKNIDDATSAYSSYPVQAGTNSFSKYQAGNFTGSFNQISNCLWAHTAGSLGTGLKLAGAVLSTYATPSTATNAALTNDMTAPISISSGQAVKFSTSSPADPSPTATLSAPGYTQYLATQLQTTTSAAPGDTGTLTLSLSYDEN